VAQPRSNAAYCWEAVHRDAARDERAAWRRWGATRLALVAAGSLVGACDDTPPEVTASGSLSGQVVVSGPLRGAAVSIDQIETRDPEMGIRRHVADTITDDQGRFSVEVGIYSGLLRVTASGGSFVDLSTGTTIELDTANGLASIVPLDLLDARDDALVSPIGHLIATRTRWKAGQLREVEFPVREAEAEASDHLNRHFGNVDWTRQKLGSLEVVAISPTEPVRAAIVQAALSELAHDIASAAGASPQEVNVLTLTQQLAADLADGTFDGNDHDDATDFTQGLQLGVCGPVANCPPAPQDACAVGACRPLCDLYAGTPRALLAGELTKVIGSSLNQTTLEVADIVAVARAMAGNTDPALFDACVENLDRLPPRLEWIARHPAPWPTSAAWCRSRSRRSTTPIRCRRSGSTTRRRPPRPRTRRSRPPASMARWS
jgi:hypothetical protein